MTRQTAHQAVVTQARVTDFGWYCACILIALVLSCTPAPVGSAQDATCPDPTPCLRFGESLAGGSSWLLDALSSGDATAAHEAATALTGRITAYQECVRDWHAD